MLSYSLSQCRRAPATMGVTRPFSTTIHCQNIQFICSLTPKHVVTGEGSRQSSEQDTPATNGLLNIFNTQQSPEQRVDRPISVWVISETLEVRSTGFLLHSVHCIACTNNRQYICLLCRVLYGEHWNMQPVCYQIRQDLSASEKS